MSILDHIPILIVVTPLLGAIISVPLGLLSARWTRVFFLLVLATTLIFSAFGFSSVLHMDSVSYYLGGWDPPWGIEYLLDSLSSGLAVLISVMAFLVGIYSPVHVSSFNEKRYASFHALYLLLLSGLLGMVMTADLFNLYVFLEISALSAYALLASGGDRAVVAVFRYLLVGSLGAFFYLLGIGYLYSVTGTLNMTDMAESLPVLLHQPAFQVGAIMVVIGLAIKTAVFPMHGWLPDVYTYALPPVSAFIASVMTKVGAYALFRFLYFILPPLGISEQLLLALGIVSAVGVVVASSLAVAQRDVRRMLAYSSVSQLGYVILGFAIGNPLALIGALLHILNHAVMKGCLFLVVGSIQWRTGGTRIEDYRGMGKKAPMLMAIFSVAALSMIGLPPLCGFFGKWYLVLGAVESEKWMYVAALVISSLLTAIYFFRVLEQAYLHGDTENDVRLSFPRSLTLPALILAYVVILIGLANYWVVEYWAKPSLPWGGGPL